MAIPGNGRRRAAAPNGGAAGRYSGPDVVLWAVAVMVFIYIWRIQSILPPLAAIKPGVLAGVAALALFLSDRTPIRRVMHLRSPLLYAFIGVVVASALSIPTSLWMGKSVMMFATDLLPNALFAILVAASIRSLDDLVWLAKVILIGALVYAFVVITLFGVEGHGRLGNLIHYDANDLALLLVCSIPFAIYFLGAEKSPPKRVFALFCLAVFVILLIRTGSRGGFLGLIGVMTFIVLRYRAIPARIRLSAVAGGGLLLMFVASDAYWEQMRTMLSPEQDYNTLAVEGRKAVWTRGIGYMVENPVLGVGLGAYPVAEGQSELALAMASAGRGFKWSVAHSSFIETGAEIGIAGLLAFIAIFVLSFRILRRIGPAPGETPGRSRRRALAQMLMVAYTGFIICGFFLSAQHFSYLYALIGMTLALWKLGRLEGDGRGLTSARPHSPGAIRVRPSVMAPASFRRG